MTPREQRVIESLALHREITGETPHHKAFDLLIRNTDRFMDRSTTLGHVTGSALVVGTQTDEALLIYAAKFDKWLLNSAGGHIDDGELPWQAAQRELREETGIDLAPMLFDNDTPLPLLLDVHAIPASVKKNEPAHWHYDMLFLFETNGKPDVKADETEITHWAWRPVSSLKSPEWPWDIGHLRALLRK
jgi:8-oxo-dGTP pyrophosphatase MutT (NUDIX family)